MANSWGRITVKGELRRILGLIIGSALAAVFATRKLSRIVRPRHNRSADPRSVLLVRLDLMGDVVNGLSAAHAARDRWPEALIVFMAPPPWTAIVERCGAVDEVIALDPAEITHWPKCLNPRHWVQVIEALRSVRARQFDLAVSIYGPIAGTFVALSGARENCGYRREAPPFSFDRALEGRREAGGPHETTLATALIGSDSPTWRTVDQVDGLPLPAALTDVPHPLVVAHAGSSHGDAKRWRENHWEHTLRTLVDKGATIAFVGLANDALLAKRLAAAVPNFIDLTSRTSLELLMGTLLAADLMISTDSGPAHLARALGTRVISLHGPTDVALHGPGEPCSVALRVEIPCGPCYNFRDVAACAFGDTLCMEWLAPTTVVQAALTALRPTLA